MPSLPSRHAAAILLAGLPTLLAGCGSTKDQFPPVCPHADLLRAAADIGRYRDESASATQDIRDLVLAGRITAISGKCQPGDSATQISADVTVGMQFSRGPAMQGREADVPVFLAITAGNEIFTKQIYPVHIVFPPNVDQTTGTIAPVHMVFPVSPTKSGAAYTILAGFQLTEDELAFNRRHAGGRP